MQVNNNLQNTKTASISTLLTKAALKTLFHSNQPSKHSSRSTAIQYSTRETKLQKKSISLFLGYSAQSCQVLIQKNRTSF
jgi:hypothetical protein